MRNKIGKFSMVVLAIVVLSTIFITSPVSATAVLGRCPEGSTSILVQEGNPLDSFDRNGNGMICGKNPPGQQAGEGYLVYIDDVVVCIPSQVAACRVPVGP